MLLFTVFQQTWKLIRTESMNEAIFVLVFDRYINENRPSWLTIYISTYYCGTESHMTNSSHNMVIENIITKTKTANVTY